MYVLFSPVGDTDPVRGDYDGAMLHIVRHYHPQRVYLFLTAEMCARDERSNCYERAVRHIAPECEVKKFSRPNLDNPSDFDIFHDIFSECLDQIAAENPGAEILINISSGTPQMKSALCLEIVSNRLSSALKAIQVTNPGKASGRGNRDYFNPESSDLVSALENNFDTLPETENRCEEPKLSDFRKVILDRQIKSLISSYEYSAAYDLIKSESIFSDRTKNLLLHGKCRTLGQAAEAERLARDLELLGDLYPNPNAKRVGDAYLALWRDAEQGNSNGTLVRAISLAEFLAREFLTKERTPIICEPVNQTDIDAKYPGLWEELNARFGGKFYGNLSLRAYSIAISFLHAQNECSAYFDNLAGYVGKRNAAAHNLENVTLAQSEQKEMLESLEKIMHYIYNVKSNFYRVYIRLNELTSESFERRTYLFSLRQLEL
jgi:CRISPR type III-A/MTUBE-associated protein Csm6